MDYEKLSDKDAIILYEGIRKALVQDDSKPPGKKEYLVRSESDWRKHTRKLEEQLDLRNLDYEKIDWTSGLELQDDTLVKLYYASEGNHSKSLMLEGYLCDEQVHKILKNLKCTALPQDKQTVEGVLLAQSGLISGDSPVQYRYKLYIHARKELRDSVMQHA